MEYVYRWREIHYTRTIIVAVGRGIAEIQKLELQEPIEYEQENLHYTVQNPEHFAGKRVLISGGGNSAVDWAIELAKLARSVVVIHRNTEFRAMERNVSEMNNITDVRTPYSITQLHNNGKRIEKVVITHMESQDNVVLEVDEVVISHGYKSNLSDLASCGLEMNDGMVLMSHHAQTSLLVFLQQGTVRRTKAKLDSLQEPSMMRSWQSIVPNNI